MNAQMCNIVDKAGAIVNKQPLHLEEALSKLAEAQGEWSLCFTDVEDVAANHVLELIRKLHLATGWLFGPTAEQACELQAQTRARFVPIAPSLNSISITNSRW